jgi:hypothetical protein
MSNSGLILFRFKVRPTEDKQKCHTTLKIRDLEKYIAFHLHPWKKKIYPTSASDDIRNYTNPH